MFALFHRKRDHKEIKSSAVAGGYLVWERKDLPNAGAMQYAFETYGTPIYDFALGNGAAIIKRPLLETQPAMWANFTAPIISNPPMNTFQGQFATQPLVDPNTALALGIVGEGNIPPGAYNTLPPMGPALAP